MTPLRVLLIEDSEDDATIIRRELRQAGYEAVAERVATADDLRAALARQAWDLVTCDYNLPGFSALAALALIREHDRNVPVIVVSGAIGEELTVSLIRAGADDLVLKHNLGRLPGAVEHALRDAENRRRGAAAEAALQSLALDNAHLLDRVARSDRIKSEFLGTMSHELRTPLNHIIGFNDLLLGDAEHLTADQADMLRAIESSGRDLLALVNGVLDVQRLEVDRAPAPLAIDVADLLRELTTATSRTCSRDLHVSCQLPPELPAVRTDPAKLEAVLQNIIDNAVKFTPHGNVTLSAARWDDGVLFTVADTGVGIPREVLPIIFEPFRQGDGSMKRRYGGVGLGLYIVRREVDLLGGEVTVESEVGRGSTFRVWIPCEPRTRSRPDASHLSDAAALFAEILDATTDLVHTATPDGQLLYANRAWRTALGYESDELRALSLDDIVHPQSRAELHQARQRALGGDPIQGVHVKCIGKDGRIVELEGSIRCRVASGEPMSLLCLCVYQNVAERAKAERQAEARRRLLETILAALPVGVWVTDETGRIIQGNPAAQRLWGGARYVGLGELGQYKGWFAAGGEPIAAEEWAVAGAIRRGETTINEELEIESFHGIRRTILQSALPLRDAAGDIAGAIIVEHDITALKQMERALRESEQRFRALVEGAADGIYVHDLFGIIADANPQVCASLGYTRDELIGRSLTDIDQHLDPERARQHLLQLESGAPLLVDTVHRRKDGSTFPVEVRSVRFLWNGHPHVLGMCRDVTERKQVEEALRAAQAALQLAAESAKIAFWESDLRALTIRFSSGWACVLGRAESTLALTALWDLVHPDDRAKTTVAMREHLQGQAATYETEQRMLHADGTYRWVLSRGIITRDPEGRPAQWFGADIDITDRKDLEEALRRSEDQYRQLVEEITDIIYTADREGRVTYMSPVAERLYGYAPAEVLDRPFTDFIFPEDLPGVIEGFREAVSGNPQPHDHRIVTKAGEVRWVRNHTRFIVKDGQIVGLRGVLSDVTKRRQVEDALRALTATLEQQVAERTRELGAVNERLQLITDNMLDMLSQVSLAGVFQYVSPAHERILGYAPQHMLGKSVLDFLHPDDIAPVTAITEAVVRGAASGKAEFRYRHADGHYLWLETVGRLLLDDRGVPTAAVLNGRDVTERKQADEAIRRNSEELARFNRLAVGRELRMIELKQRANDLARQLGQAPPYPLAFLRAGDGPPADHLDADGSALPRSAHALPKESTKA